MMKQYVLFGIGVTVTLFCGSLWGQTSEQDARAVRAAYAKLSLALSVGDAKRVIDGTITALDIPEITLSSITTGDVSEIMSVPYQSIVTKPTGNILQITNSVWNEAVRGQTPQRTNMAHAAWAVGPYFTEDWSLPFSQALGYLPADVVPLRYARAIINLSFQGQTRQYGALFLFGVDVVGKPEMLVMDNIIGLSAMSQIVRSPISMEPLLKGHRDNAVTKQLIKLFRGQATCSREQITGMCCDPISGICGLAPDVFPGDDFIGSTEQGSSAQPASRTNLIVRPIHANDDPFCGDEYSDEPDYEGTSDSTGHSTGQHAFSGSFNPLCQYHWCAGCNHCMSKCTLIPSFTAADEGITFPYCHTIVPSSVEGIVSDQTGAKCSSAYAVGVSSGAIMCGAGSLGISWSGVTATITGANVWQYTVNDSYTCSAP